MSVIRVTDPIARDVIERFTLQYCKPDAVKFIQDGNGDWITSVENLQNKRYTFEKTLTTQTRTTVETKLREEVKREPTLTVRDNEYTNLADLLQRYGEVIDYVPVPDTLEGSTETKR
jgi:hypothetical protein